MSGLMPFAQTPCGAWCRSIRTFVEQGWTRILKQVRGNALSPLLNQVPGAVSEPDQRVAGFQDGRRASKSAISSSCESVTAMSSRPLSKRKRV